VRAIAKTLGVSRSNLYDKRIEGKLMLTNISPLDESLLERIKELGAVLDN